MKKKTIIVISLVAVLALGGTIALAATGEGAILNPFSRILGEKVADGTITQDEANTFSKVWNAIKGDDEVCRGMGNPQFDKDTMEAIKDAGEKIQTAMEKKTDEVIAGLVSEGYISQEQVDAWGDKPIDLKYFAKDADAETLAAIKDAIAELTEYRKTLIDEMVDEGVISEDVAGFLQNNGYRGIKPGMKRPGAWGGPFTGKQEDKTEDGPGL